MKKRLSNDPVTEKELHNIEDETAIKFQGKGKPMFTNSRPKKVQEEEKKVEVPEE